MNVPKRREDCQALGLLTALRHDAELFRDCDVSWFCDNAGVCCSMIRGQSKAHDVSHIAAVTHLALASLGARVWIDWVDTASNPADGVSRDGVLDVWSQGQGWDITEVPPLTWYSYPSDPFTCVDHLCVGS